MRSNLHIYPSPFRFETRILKESKSLISQNLVDNVIIASTWEMGLLENELLDSERSVKRFKLFFNRFRKSKLIDSLKYCEFIFKVFFYYRSKKLNFVNCHSLLVLPIGVLLKKFGSSKVLIYDTHELETERAGLNGVVQKFTKFLENLLIKYIDKIIVVCDPIAEWYKKTYSLNQVYVVRNLPYSHKPPANKPTILKDKFDIPNHHILFIYQGLLSRSRGVYELLDVFSKAPDDKHIVFMGYGPDESVIKDWSMRYKNIHFQPAVKPEEIISYTSSADIGLNFIIGNICLSYQYSLPNKFGEYILSGVPILVSSSLSYLSSIVFDVKCGWSINSENSRYLAEFIENLNFPMVTEARNHVLNYAPTLGWEFEEKIFKEVYK
jgi:hypothetical protein